MAHAMPIHAPPRHVARPFDADNGQLPSISAEPSFSRHFAPPIAMSRLPFQDSVASPSSISAPMAIRGADRQNYVPPPLPPPRLVPVDGPVDPTLQIKERERERRLRERNGSTGSTGSDSFGLSFEPTRRDPYSSSRNPLDEGYHSMDVSRSSESPLYFARQPLSSFRSLDGRTNRDIDSAMISKLNGRRSGLSASLSAGAPPIPRPNPPLSALSLPYSNPSALDSAGPFTRSPILMTPGGNAALSPHSGVSPFGHQPATASDRSPGYGDTSALERSPLSHTRGSDSNPFPDDVTVSTQTSLEAREEEGDFLTEETRRVRRLNIGDGLFREREREWEWERERERQQREADQDLFCRQVGQKRRASSPLSEDFGFGNGPAGPLASDMVKRRDGGSNGVFGRCSPTLRQLPVPQLCASSTLSASRNGSLTASTLNLSVLAFSRGSPPALSPEGSGTSVSSPVDSNGAESPYAPSTSSLGHALRLQQQQQPQLLPNMVSQQQKCALGEPSMTAAPAGRTPISSPSKLADMPRSASKHAARLVVHKLKGPWMCECCPKKPKKFNTEEELRLHENEKQYGCQYCGNRFKNKNEMERHQNSLHVRAHSWSCSALTARGYERAFHDSTTRPGDADVCGYCGDEFDRTGPRAALNEEEGLGAGGVAADGGDVAMGGIGGDGPRQVTEMDWEARMDHLQNTHKFRECNASKKFFRADHFRQHLKHSHGGTSGKWTNMLENACMVDEEAPTPPAASART